MTRLHICEVVVPAFVLPPIFTRFVLVRVGYLRSSEAYTNNWDLFGKEHYLAANGENIFNKY